MNEKQLAALFDWLDHQTYDGVPGTDNDMFLAMKKC